MIGDAIQIRGARENNLRNLDLDIPRNKVTVITGLSGSGKSTLAFDTIYAEGQRRYIDSISAYARQFLEQLKKPEVDSIVGLSPAIAIDQSSHMSNPRSTVGTVTETYDYLRLLFARIGIPYSPKHGIPVKGRTTEGITTEILKMPEGRKIIVLAPVVQGKKGEFHKEVQKWIKQGFVRGKIDGEYIELTEVTKLAKTKRHDIDIVTDRLIVQKGVETRLKEAVQRSIQLSEGMVAIELPGNDQRQFFSTLNTCPLSGFTFPPIEPRLFSFNDPKGACPTCSGLGYLDNETTTRDAQNEDDVEDVLTESQLRRCPSCEGARIRSDMLHVKINSYNIAQLANLPVQQLIEHLNALKLSERDNIISEKILIQLKQRLEYLNRLGVGYLSLNRSMRTLSGGEAQRLRLATQVGSKLVGIMYVLDEPSIGLHPSDHNKLLAILREINQLGNTVIIVEHDEDTIDFADYILDIGPGAGIEGGEITAAGSPQQIRSNKKSLTGLYLSGKRRIPVPDDRRIGNGYKLTLRNASGNNLKNIDVDFPLGCLIGVSGVSGSGKSTLVIDTLYKSALHYFRNGMIDDATIDCISGFENLDRVLQINQKPIGRTPRSNPATYVGLLPLIRDLFAMLPESKMFGYKPGHFSFNTKGGRCEHCQGAGTLRVEMHFLSDVFVPCEVCRGKRFDRETLEIRYKEKNIADVLAMSVAEACEFFSHHAYIRRKLDLLAQVGLGYLTLGQSSTTLSGGEAQRIKLSRELSKRSTGKTLYILDEPTTGLHFHDIEKLLVLLQSLVDAGNTVVVIEHNSDVLKCCDHIIDLGPDGGVNGGKVVGIGTPEQICKIKGSHTGHYLKSKLIV
mgnify:CR=1 FL=1